MPHWSATASKSAARWSGQRERRAARALHVQRVGHVCGPDRYAWWSQAGHLIDGSGAGVATARAGGNEHLPGGPSSGPSKQGSRRGSWAYRTLSTLNRVVVTLGTGNVPSSSKVKPPRTDFGKGGRGLTLEQGEPDFGKGINTVGNGVDSELLF